MKCPVCGMDCVKSAQEILAALPEFFKPCPSCSIRTLDKRLPHTALDFVQPCSCGKRFIDEVFAHIYVIMVEEGDLTLEDPLIAAGSPLIHPGFAMDRPPFLPHSSLVLLSARVRKKAATRIVQEVPEVRGVVKTGDFVPGIPDPGLKSVPRVYELLAGCDVRADLFPIPAGPLVVYKQQSVVHIEFPRAGHQKIQSVIRHVGNPPARFFIDACSGVGTLGLAAAGLGVNHVIMNDAWYASAFWSAFNLEVNRHYFHVDRVRIFEQIDDLQKHPVNRDQIKIAETEGEQVIEVYQGDFRSLPDIISAGDSPLTALDLFDKKDPLGMEKIQQEWIRMVGGEVFIP